MAGGVAFRQLAKIVGEGNVATDEETLEAYSKDESFLPPRKPFFVVSPNGMEEVQEVVKLAGVTRTPLVPVSSGPPHFRGDTVPEYGGIVLDMSGMKAIRLVDRLDRVAMIEPGVRFGELQTALKREGLKLPMPLQPRSTKSVLASFLEREPHTIPKYHLDHTEPMLCAEMVFGTGDIFRTGEAAGPAPIDEMQDAGWRQKLRWEPQTEFMRLVQGAQGTMGIVTWATVRCEILPTIQKPSLAGADDLGDLLGFAYRLVRLKVGDEILILNAKNAASLVAGDASDIERLAGSLPKWLLLFSISGYHMFPEDRVEMQQGEAKKIAQALGVAMSDAVSEVSAKRLLRAVGEPSKNGYWKLREKGGCQDLCFISSYDGVPQHVEVMAQYANERDFPLADVGVYIQPVNQGHGYHCEFSFFHDRDGETEREKVRDLYVSLGSTLMNQGAFFSRPYDLLADPVFNRDAVTRETLRKIKSVFDPQHILNPGKLCF